MSVDSDGENYLDNLDFEPHSVRLVVSSNIDEFKVFDDLCKSLVNPANKAGYVQASGKKKFCFNAICDASKATLLDSSPYMVINEAKVNNAARKQKIEADKEFLINNTGFMKIINPTEKDLEQRVHNLHKHLKPKGGPAPVHINPANIGSFKIAADNVNPDPSGPDDCKVKVLAAALDEDILTAVRVWWDAAPVELNLRKLGCNGFAVVEVLFGNGDDVGVLDEATLEDVKVKLAQWLGGGVTPEDLFIASGSLLVGCRVSLLKRLVDSLALGFLLNEMRTSGEVKLLYLELDANRKDVEIDIAAAQRPTFTADLLLSMATLDSDVDDYVFVAEEEDEGELKPPAKEYLTGYSTPADYIETSSTSASTLTAQDAFFPPSEFDNFTNAANNVSIGNTGGSLATQSRNSDGDTQLFIAARDGNLEKVRGLIRDSADVNQGNKKGVTPLAIAVEKAKASQMAIIMMLVEEGADVDATNKKGVSPLLVAIQSSPHEVIRYLAARAQVDLPNHDGQTPLLLSASKGSIRDVTLLVSERQANINCADKRGTTPLIAAVENGHHDVVDYLCNKSADMDRKKNNGESALDVARRMDENGPITTCLENHQASKYAVENTSS